MLSIRAAPTATRVFDEGTAKADANRPKRKALANITNKQNPNTKASNDKIVKPAQNGQSSILKLAESKKGKQPVPITSSSKAVAAAPKLSLNSSVRRESAEFESSTPRTSASKAGSTSSTSKLKTNAAVEWQRWWDASKEALTHDWDVEGFVGAATPEQTLPKEFRGVDEAALVEAFKSARTNQRLKSPLQSIVESGMDDFLQPERSDESLIDGVPNSSLASPARKAPNGSGHVIDHTFLSRRTNSFQSMRLQDDDDDDLPDLGL